MRCKTKNSHIYLTPREPIVYIELLINHFMKNTCEKDQCCRANSKIIPRLKHYAQEKLGSRENFAIYIANILSEEKIEPTCIVDLGCGTGTTVRALAKLFPHAEVFGYEIDKARLVKNSDYPKNVSFKVIPPFSLQNEKLRPDAIILGGVIHHVSQKNEDCLLQDVYKALNDNARLIVHEHRLSKNPIRRKLERVLLSASEFIINDFLESMVCNYNFFEDARLRNVLERNGFEIVKSENMEGRFVTLPSLNGNTVYICRKKI